MPTSAEKPTAMRMALVETRDGQPASCATRWAAPAPRPMPSAPPMVESVVASMRNWLRMSRGRAPTASRSPISRVRSVTETSMMFMMPMPPTSRETPATAARRSDKVPADADALAAGLKRHEDGVVLVLPLRRLTLRRHDADDPERHVFHPDGLADRIGLA